MLFLKNYLYWKTKDIHSGLFKEFGKKYFTPSYAICKYRKNISLVIYRERATAAPSNGDPPHIYIYIIIIITLNLILVDIHIWIDLFVYLLNSIFFIFFYWPEYSRHILTVKYASLRFDTNLNRCEIFRIYGEKDFVKKPLFSLNKTVMVIRGRVC